jgi:serine/threonine protein kinase
MSPEQARGKTVDKRADIWAFGCVLYEMLTGRTAFPGETLSDTIVAILDRAPGLVRGAGRNACSGVAPAAPMSREGRAQAAA